MRQCGYSFRGYRAEVHRQLSNWNPRIKAIPIICTEGLIEIGIHRGITNNLFTRAPWGQKNAAILRRRPLLGGSTVESMYGFFVL